VFHLFVFLAGGLAGWAGGQIVGDHGFGRGTDILLGIMGAFVVGWSVANLTISLEGAHLVRPRS